LRGSGNPRMYRELTVNTPGCVAFSRSCSAGNFKFRKIPAFSQPLPPASAMRGQKVGRFQARAASDPRPLQFQGRFRMAAWPRYPVPVGNEGNFRRTRFGAEPWPSATNKGGIAVAIVFQTGRRLMRQTVLPTKTRDLSAATRNDSSAPRIQSRSSGSARRPGLRFGLPLTPESGGPSRPPTAQHALSAPRARRRQEFKNAQQNVDRRHPPGRDPGRRGPRQSSRRV
jgi:hypothetical protein